MRLGRLTLALQFLAGSDAAVHSTPDAPALIVGFGCLAAFGEDGALPFDAPACSLPAFRLTLGSPVITNGEIGAGGSLSLGGCDDEGAG
jgi:hypothetical protein